MRVAVSSYYSTHSLDQFNFTSVTSRFDRYTCQSWQVFKTRYVFWYSVRDLTYIMYTRSECSCFETSQSTLDMCIDLPAPHIPRVCSWPSHKTIWWEWEARSRKDGSFSRHDAHSTISWGMSNWLGKLREIQVIWNMFCVAWSKMLFISVTWFETLTCVDFTNATETLSWFVPLICVNLANTRESGT